MSDSIRVEHLSKQYFLGKASQQTMLRERLASFLKNPFAKQTSVTDTLWALRDASFGIKAGEAVGIIGRNRAGKSTLLKVLSKIAYPASGRGKARGRVASVVELGIRFAD